MKLFAGRAGIPTVIAAVLVLGLSAYSFRSHFLQWRNAAIGYEYASLRKNGMPPEQAAVASVAEGERASMLMMFGNHIPLTLLLLIAIGLISKSTSIEFKKSLRLLYFFVCAGGIVSLGLASPLCGMVSGDEPAFVSAALVYAAFSGVLWIIIGIGVLLRGRQAPHREHPPVAPTTTAATSSADITPPKGHTSPYPPEEECSTGEHVEGDVSMERDAEALNRQFEDELKDLNDNHEEELRSLQNAHGRSLQKLKSQISVLQGQLERERAGRLHAQARYNELEARVRAARNGKSLAQIMFERSLWPVAKSLVDACMDIFTKYAAFHSRFLAAHLPTPFDRALIGVVVVLLAGIFLTIALMVAPKALLLVLVAFLVVAAAGNVILHAPQEQADSQASARKDVNDKADRVKSP